MNKKYRKNPMDFLVSHRISKRGQMWRYLIGGIIALIVLIVVIVFFTRGGKQAYGGLGEKIGELQDCDKDTVADLFDKCPCDPSVLDEWPEDRKEKKECKPASAEAQKRCDKCK